MQIIYQLLKLFPVKNKIVMISRQSNDPSIDFILLRDEIEKEAPACKVVFLCKTLDGGVDSTFRRKLGYMCHMLCQMYHLATSKAGCIGHILYSGQPSETPEESQGDTDVAFYGNDETFRIYSRRNWRGEQR